MQIWRLRRDMIPLDVSLMEMYLTLHVSVNHEILRQEANGP